jgi:hypothetical protein
VPWSPAVTAYRQKEDDVPTRRSMKEKLVDGEGPLSRVPPFVAFLVVAAVFVVGILIGGGVGALLLGVLAAGIATLLAVTWRALSPSERAGRVFILAVLVAVAVSVLLAK